jgi:benzoylformate decarboxylase
VPAAIARAYYHALEPPCGPTFVSIPIDDWGKACAPLTLRSIVADNPGNPEAIAAAGQRLAAATSPALIVAAGVGRDNA